MQRPHHREFSNEGACQFALGWRLILLSSCLLVLLGCEEEPAGPTEKAAIAAMQRVHAHVETDDKGHAIKLYLVKADLRPNDLAPLSDLKDLQFLTLEKSTVTDAALAHLAGLTNLKQLSLRGTDVTDAGLEHLSGLTSLTELDLEQTKITNAGLKALDGISSLRKLYVGPGGPTSAGIDALKAANPRLSVMRK